MELMIRVKQFEGPLDLLLYLVQKNEMPINDINIREITSQYLETIELMKDFNIDLASDFLLMAATLIAARLKCRRDYMAHGPYLAMGAVIALFWGPELWDIYRG